MNGWRRGKIQKKEKGTRYLILGRRENNWHFW